MIEPTLSAIIEISINENEQSYHARSYIEVDRSITESNDKLPRDVILAMVYELQVLLNTLTLKTNITDEELGQYINERQVVTLDKPETTLNNNDINSAIDKLFED